ncbi:MAG: allophanate hydrolase [Symploca sp. SIO2G7]|nr:allophanate hydrolase [Symploca sp. SIO2G7]
MGKISLEIQTLKNRYQLESVTLGQVIKNIYQAIQREENSGVWIYLLPIEKLLARVHELESIPTLNRDELPLWGIPFSVKDCIDVAGLPTTDACPEFAYIAEQTNPAVQKLLDAGAILIGKTNLDQFATGLVGTRTGYSVPYNPYNSAYITGGSSSGAAVSVALNQVSFAVATDTGGSGRVPASFNNVVGLKPTKGLLSTTHISHACRSLDCISIFATTAQDAWKVIQVAKGYDAANPYSRREPDPACRKTFQPGESFTVGVPQVQQREFFGNPDVATLFEQAIATLIAMGGKVIETDYTPFMEVNQLLFEGPWVAERYGSVGKFVEANPDAVVPTTRTIILRAKDISATEVFEGQYQLARLKRVIAPIWKKIDCLVVPTTGTIYTIAEVQANPLSLNKNLGYYTNFVNLLDLAAIAIPNGFQRNGLPSGITMIAPPFTEQYLVKLGHDFRQQRGLLSSESHPQA